MQFLQNLCPQAVTTGSLSQFKQIGHSNLASGASAVSIIQLSSAVCVMFAAAAITNQMQSSNTHEIIVLLERLYKLPGILK